MIRVLLADSHQLLHAGIHTILSTSSEITLIDAATHDRQLQQLCRQYQPDVVLLALNVTGRPYPDVLADIQQQCPTAKIVILLHDPDELDLHQLMAMGAAGGILKSDAPARLIEAIQAVAAGQNWFSPALMTQQPPSQNEEQSAPLTEREIEVLQLVASGKIDKEIAPLLGITERTVRYHLQNVNDKLGTTTRAEAVAEALRRKIIG